MAQSSGSVTVLGLGRMGAALAGAFARAGGAVTVWNRTASRAEPLRPLGVVISDSAANACGKSDVVVMCVSDYDVARALLAEDEVALVLEGRTLVQLTSGTPAQARELAGWASVHGVGHVEGKILCYPEAIGTPQAVVFYAGSASHFEAAKPLLAALGGDPFFAGDDPGHVAVIDGALIINTMALYVANMLGRAMCVTEGIAPEAWSFFEEILLTDAPRLVNELNARLDVNDLAGDQAGLSTWAHGAELIHDAVVEIGLDASLARCVRDLVRRAIDGGHADDGFAAVYQVLTQTSG
jgi:3-hydroxyisobutyrate dehydrogenase-like beta-hydroxyacid dehydrogenase